VNSIDNKQDLPVGNPHEQVLFSYRFNIIADSLSTCRGLFLLAKITRYTNVVVLL
jgi:hypothetical protein